jgi:hypothetical protein
LRGEVRTLTRGLGDRDRSVLDQFEPIIRYGKLTSDDALEVTVQRRSTPIGAERASVGGDAGCGYRLGQVCSGQTGADVRVSTPPQSPASQVGYRQAGVLSDLG